MVLSQIHFLQNIQTYWSDTFYWKCTTPNELVFAYTADRMYWFGGFEYFVKSEFEREPLMLDKQMIPHFNALDVGSKISQEQQWELEFNRSSCFYSKNPQ